MNLSFLVIVFFACQTIFAQNDSTLFVIKKNDRYGYIDRNGKVVIEPRFRRANDFSEGVASVREDGLYGFIDPSGKFITAEKYDYADSFRNDLCYAYIDGEDVIIDKREAIVLKEPFSGIRLPKEQERNCVVYTKTGKCGLWNLPNAKPVTDTIYRSINDFYKGVAVARLYQSGAVAVLGNDGRYIVQPGIYREIGDFTEDGVALVEFDDDTEGAIDVNGTLLFRYDAPNSYISGDFHSGYAVVTNYSSPDGVCRTGYIGLNGKLAYCSEGLKEAHDFFGDRAIIETDEGYLLIDRRFRPVGTHIFSEAYDDFTSDCPAAITDYLPVLLGDTWGVTDVNGNFTSIAVSDDMQPYRAAGAHFIFLGYDRDDESFYMITTKAGKLVSNEKFSQIDPNGFQNGLLRVMIKESLAYINEKGEVIWKEEEPGHTGTGPLNVDFMLHGYNTAYSETERYNGWGRSDNFPKKIASPSFPHESLSLVIDTANRKLFEQDYSGYAMYLANTTGDTVAINASDSRLDIVMQALDKAGQWKDIEYCPQSWCGNSYHTLHLPAAHYWEFTVPEYEGALKTKLRAVLRYYEGKTKKECFSNEIDGSINPAQFFNKQPHYPSGIMDPYSG